MGALVVLVAGFLTILVILRAVTASIIVGAIIRVRTAISCVITVVAGRRKCAAEAGDVRQQYTDRSEGSDKSLKPKTHHTDPKDD
jgi:hypothetical protein